MGYDSKHTELLEPKEGYNLTEKEYKKYSEKTLSQVEKDYLNEIKSIEQKAKKGGKEDE